MRTITTRGGVKNCQTDTPRRARNHQLHFARQVEEGDHRAEQNGEWQSLFGECRGSQEREARHENSGGALRESPERRSNSTKSTA